MTTAHAAAVVQAGAEGAPGSGGSSRCDFCEEAQALVFCRADSARLCLACDRHVHAANAVSSNHHRALLCDACLAAPSSILLYSPQRPHGGHPRLLCPNCDFDEAHRAGGDGGRAGERRPVEPYSGCPAAEEMLALLGVSAEKEKSLLLGSDLVDVGDGGGAEEGCSLLLAEEGWVWETPPILSMEDILVPTSSCHGFQALGVPPPPKDRNAACGKHRDEILRQLRELVKSEACVSSDFGLLEAEMGFQSQQEIQLGDMISNVETDVAPVVVPCSQPEVLHKDCCETDGVPAFCSEDQLETCMGEGTVFLDGPVSAYGGVSDAMSRDDLPLLAPTCGYKLSGLDRDTVLSRYKEKRKTRRFDRQVRYVSRKVRADGRMRIKGRFAKVIQNAET